MRGTSQQAADAPIGSAVNMRRFVNDSIHAAARRSGGRSQTPVEFLCECGDLRCPRTVRLTLEEYEQSGPGSVR
jgi:hypothetical protein